jgi:hypothetical protein
MEITKMPQSIADNAYNVTHRGAELKFILSDVDFYREYNKKTRGELFFAEVPANLRKKGIGLAMCQAALTFMKSHGTKTVNMSPTSAEGRLLVTSLIHHGDVSLPIKIAPSGKMEFRIL